MSLTEGKNILGYVEDRPGRSGGAPPFRVFCAKAKELAAAKGEEVIAASSCGRDRRSCKDSY